MSSEYEYAKESSRINRFNTLAIMFAALTAGQTITNFNPNVLKLLSTPFFQFIIYFIILRTIYKDNPTVTNYDLIIETTLFVIIVHAAKYIIDYLLTSMR